MRKIKMNEVELKQKIYDGLADKKIEINEKIKSRIEFEWETFSKNDQLNYLAFYYDLVSFAKDNDIKIGSGSGFSCCSLILYALNITQINPLEYGLIFERMRKILDLDLDFDVEGPKRIINYLKQKYGENNVLRPVVYSDVHKIPHLHGCKWIIKKDGDVLPVSKADGEPVVMYEAAEVDKLQLFNVDLFGLNVLSDIKGTVALIKERYDVDIVFDSDKCDDEKTFSLINSLDTEDIFFLSGDSFKQLIKKYPVNCLNDISFIMALYRPPFIESSGIRYERQTALSKYLTETDGLLLYQEQVMEILHDLCDIDYAEAERIRKLLARRKCDEAFVYKKVFTEKVSVKYGHEIANEIWDYLWNDCRYCFLKAHSISYAFMAYQSAYLKANYRKEFGEIFITRRKELLCKDITENEEEIV